MHILIKSRIFIYLAAITALLFVGACTLEDGEPLGHAAFELTIEEPTLGPNFALESFEVEVESLHLLAAAETGEEPEEEDDHGHDHDHDHGHDHGDEAASSPGAEDLEIAHLEIDALITNSDTISLGEVAITNGLPAASVEIEVHALSVTGVLTRDGEQIPTRVVLEHAHLVVSGAADVSFGVDKPETQHLSVSLHWPENWLEDVAIDALEVGEDGELVIGGASNGAAAEAIAEHLHGASLTLSVH